MKVNMRVPWLNTAGFAKELEKIADEGETNIEPGGDHPLRAFASLVSLEDLGS